MSTTNEMNAREKVKELLLLAEALGVPCDAKRRRFAECEQLELVDVMPFCIGLRKSANESGKRAQLDALCASLRKCLEKNSATASPSNPPETPKLETQPETPKPDTVPPTPANTPPRELVSDAPTMRDSPSPLSIELPPADEDLDFFDSLNEILINTSQKENTENIVVSVPGLRTAESSRSSKKRGFEFSEEEIEKQSKRWSFERYERFESASTEGVFLFTDDKNMTDFPASSPRGSIHSPINFLRSIQTPRKMQSFFVDSPRHLIPKDALADNEVLAEPRTMPTIFPKEIIFRGKGAYYSFDDSHSSASEGGYEIASATEDGEGDDDDDDDEQQARYRMEQSKAKVLSSVRKKQRLKLLKKPRPVPALPGFNQICICFFLLRRMGIQSKEQVSAHGFTKLIRMLVANAKKDPVLGRIITAVYEDDPKDLKIFGSFQQNLQYLVEGYAGYRPFSDPDLLYAKLYELYNQLLQNMQE